MPNRRTAACSVPSIEASGTPGRRDCWLGGHDGQELRCGRRCRPPVALLGAAPSTSAATGSVLFVVGSPASVLADEQAAATRLAGTGFTVAFADDATVTPAEAQAATFVMVGNSVDSATLQDRLATVSVPL